MLYIFKVLCENKKPNLIKLTLFIQKAWTADLISNREMLTIGYG